MSFARRTLSITSPSPSPPLRGGEGEEISGRFEFGIFMGMLEFKSV